MGTWRSDTQPLALSLRVHTHIFACMCVFGRFHTHLTSPQPPHSLMPRTSVIAVGIVTR